MDFKPLMAALVATLLLACGEGTPESSPTAERELGTRAQGIVGGYATSDYHAVGYMQRPHPELGWKRSCSLTLVAANAALTAAHCVDKLGVQRGTCGALSEARRVGFGPFQNAAAPYTVIRACLHPEYVDGSDQHDLALVFLDGTVNITPMALAGAEYPDATPIGRQLRVVGYGNTQQGMTKADSEAGLYYNPLRKGALMVVSYAATYNLHARGDDSSTIGGAPCFGDSGGPILSLEGTKLYGVNSTLMSPYECSKSAKAGFSAVGRESWIRTTLAQNPPKPGSAPAAASWGPGRIDLFEVSMDGMMLHRWFDGSAWSSWESLSFNGERFQMDPTVVSWGSGRLDLFARGADSALWHLWYEGGRWSSWQSLGGYITSSPSAVSMEPGHLDVFARATDNAIWHRWFNRSVSWQPWASLGGALSSGPAACSWGNGRIDVFASGYYDGRIYQRVYDAGGGWHGWYGPMNDVPTSDASCASLGFQNVNIFYRGQDGSLMQKYWTPGSSWVGGFSLGGQISGGPEAMRYNGGELFIFALDPNRTAPYMKHYNGYVWSGWTLF